MSKELGAVLAKRMGVTEEEQLSGFLSRLLQWRAQTAEEIPRAALFLCSDQSSAMTGQSINVDGSLTFSYRAPEGGLQNSRYSKRKTTRGSTRVARRAGR